MTLARLPAACLDRHVAILGASDAGKTYAAKGEVEQLLLANKRVGVIDPTGVWWGLRVPVEEGLGGSFRVVIFGGDHADLPIPADGARLAEVVAGGEFSWILDVSRLTVGARTRLFAEFAEGLQRFNRAPLHLAIDEAHLFAPQGRVFDPMSGRMLHAANSLVSGGRALGLRVILISQRPAKLHKDSLTQVQTLVAMFMISPQDRSAVAAWIADAADKAKGAEILASLPTLQVGEAWVWAPRLDVLERAKFAPIVTFDSSRTPDASTPTPALQPLDLAALRAQLEDQSPAGVDEAAGPPASTPAKPDETAALRERISVLEKRLNVERGEGWRDGVEWAKAQFRELVSEVGRERTKPETTGYVEPVEPPKPPPITSGTGPDRLERALRSSPRMVTWEEAAVLAGYHPTGGAFRQARKALRESGRVEEADGLVRAFVPGGELLTPPRRGEIIAGWCAKLEGLAPKLLTHIQRAGGRARVSDLNAEIGVSATGGYARKGWKDLRVYNLVTVDDGEGRLAPILMELPE